MREVPFTEERADVESPMTPKAQAGGAVDTGVD